MNKTSTCTDTYVNDFTNLTDTYRLSSHHHMYRYRIPEYSHMLLHSDIHGFHLNTH